LKKFRKTPVYNQPGQTNIRETKERSGVYLIYYGSDKKPVYIGMSASNLYKTILRHFQEWNDPAQQRTVYPQDPLYKVSVVYTTPKQAPKLEKMLILRHKPDDNRHKWEGLEIENIYTEDKKVLNTFDLTPTELKPPF
jgi:excinuclease UvrABC nuclease subunit